eukprot:CAMPEP_0183746546 /NCGR_PEP_ID=MMETSP0737-20130205/66814_1 /TAXON_ID=385413 /ORGANISM="Thalassiosira miniscula, Strain CCMP1093" /LENGTH=516 /DNA_ID=CAMNT_0025982245 /DNA_START=286 /DNA_END=1833 /DNA_ORIENTATION=-
MSPTALDEETTKRRASSSTKESDKSDSKTKKKKANKTPINQYFNLSSNVRSTTQTEAIGTKPPPKEEDTEEETRIPPEVLQPFSLLLLSQFLLFLGVGAVIPSIPLYGQSIGLSGQANGIVISAPAVALLLVSRLAGEYADTGRKGAMMGGMALIAVSDLGTALSNGLGPLVLARLGLGLGRGYAEAGERGMLTDLANRAPNLRGRALALQQACTALGIALGAPLGGLVVERYGVRSSFLCVTAAALVALGTYSILPETVVGRDSNGMESGSTSKEDVIQTNDNEADWVELLKTSSTWRTLAVAQIGVSFGFACKISVIPILANSYLGGATGAGLLISAAGLAGLVGAPLGGFLADKAGSRVAAAVAGTAGGASLALVPLGLSFKGMETSMPAAAEALNSSSANFWQSILTGLGGPEATAFTLLVLLWSVGTSAQGPALTALAQENAPLGSEATALGLPRAVGDGTYIVAPLILGLVTDKLGESVPGISCTIAGCAICVGSIALFLFASEENMDEK